MVSLRFGTAHPASLLVCMLLQSLLAMLGSSSEARAQGPTRAGTQPEIFWVYVGTYTTAGMTTRARGSISWSWTFARED